MRLKSVNIQGYRPFKNFQAPLQPLEIIVGANGAGKSSLFEFLKFLRDSLFQDIPPEIVRVFDDDADSNRHAQGRHQGTRPRTLQSEVNPQVLSLSRKEEQQRRNE
ncbi:MAG: AAA family ATPase, partial [Dolichospermum sp.]